MYVPITNFPLCLKDIKSLIDIHNKDGIEIANAVANIALNSDDKIVTFGANFVKPGKSKK